MRSAHQETKSVTGKSQEYQPQNVGTHHAEVRVKGKAVPVPSTQLDGRTVITSGKWIKIAVLQDEELLEGETVADPGLFVSDLKKTALAADIFTFAQELPDTTPKFAYHRELDSLAVIPITTYPDWWEKRASHDVRAAVKKATKHGVIVKEAQLDDTFVEGIVRIYNECEYRQGKPFWHYGKDFDSVKQISSTYLNRSTLIGAYLDDELIGFIKMVQVRNIAKTLHVISMKKHFSKKPTNALIAKAVEICAQRGNTHLVYGNYVYKDPKSSLTEFKRRNGFEEVLIPRYYIPMTLKGKIALQMKLHHRIADLLPLRAWRMVSRLRALAVQYRRV